MFKMHLKKLFIVALMAVLVISITSCGKQGASKKSGTVKVAFITNNVSDFWSIAKAGVEKGEKDFGVTCEFKMPTQGTASEQKQILEDMVVRGVSGIAISAVDPKNQTGVLDDVASKVNLITHDSDAPTSKRLCYIGTNNYQAGLVAGKELLKALPNGGKVMAFVGTIGAANARDRFKGINDAIKGSKIVMLGCRNDDTDHAKAKANVEDTLTKYADVAGLVGLWSYNGPAIAEAVKAAGMQGKVKCVCFDEDPSTLQAVKDGVVNATIVQKPFEFGYQSVRVLAALAKKQDAKIPDNKQIDTGVRVIDKSNVVPFWAELKTLTGK